MINILNKWILGFIKHPINVIKGNWFRFFNKNERLYYSRYKHCLLCSEKEYTPIGKVCGLCGCPLESKLRVEEEKCELDKWN